MDSRDQKSPSEMDIRTGAGTFDDQEQEETISPWRSTDCLLITKCVCVSNKYCSNVTSVKLKGTHALKTTPSTT